MTELDLKLQDLKNILNKLKEENKRLKFSIEQLEKELKEYRELDEKGLLLKPACKVGNKAYHVIKDNIANPPIYISEHEIKDVSTKAVYFADDWWNLEEMHEMNAYLTKEAAELAVLKLMNKKVNSITEVDLSSLRLPVAAVYEKPLDFPNNYVIRIFDVDKPTNVVMVKDTLEELMEDIAVHTNMTFLTRGPEDDEHLIGVWM